MKVRYSRRAEQDLEQIGSFIARDNPRAAARVQQAIRATIALIVENPYIGTRNVRAPELRSYPLRRYPYRVHYAVAQNEIAILHIRHSARRPIGWSE